ncbi:hypothetical protein PG993_010727 [Apiospora rasikravindrae]|uniref:Protein kinase domain-containing protein n=1 Tax=Apiospora rasikravindrae TaxID=990691 RepID=A0ABR1SC64_9PEZI
MTPDIPSCESANPKEIQFVRQSYDERGAKGTEPTERWLSLVLYKRRSKWHVRVAFHGALQSSTDALFKKTKRRQDLENLCLCIDFCRISCIDNTVTELLISLDEKDWRLPLQSSPGTDNAYAAKADSLWASVQEDPKRVRYPLYDPSSPTPIMELKNITKAREVEAGVHEARIDGDPTLYIYKQIERPFYVPRDSAVLIQELRNLELVGGTENIVKLIAAVISENPYQTTDEEGSTTVSRGILIEHHPNGTLKDALHDPKRQMDGRWLVWSRQIAKALARLHVAGLAHMDLKPSNVVITAEWNAVVIDISGIGGVTREWLLPELRKEADPLSQSLEVRKQSDIWALGQILYEMAEVSTQEDKQSLRTIADAATKVPGNSLSYVMALLPDRVSG